MERNDGTERGNGTARHAHVLKMQWWDFSNVVEIVVEIYNIYIYTTSNLFGDHII